MDLLNEVIEKNLVFPQLPKEKGKNSVIKQLDIALMSNGFKLSHELFEYIRTTTKETATEFSNTLLKSIKKLVGGHVKHNTYFIDFPNNIPDTWAFWSGLLDKYFQATGKLTNNLLDFPEYGNYQHDYEEMIDRHKKLKLENPDFKIIHLGKTLSEELKDLYKTVAGSSIPLNDSDKELLVLLLKNSHYTVSPVPVRENKAFINEFLLSVGKPLLIDTLIDILRLVVSLSKGDVSLKEVTKFKSLSRANRRLLMESIENLVKKDKSKLDDISSYKEEFKRLAKNLHPSEFKSLKNAQKVFSFAHDNLDIKTWRSKVHNAIAKNKTKVAVELLSEKPGYLFRNLDKITRDSNETNFKLIKTNVKHASKNVATRVLLGVNEHILNRASKTDYRLFINQKGKGFVIQNNLESLKHKGSDLMEIIEKEVGNRFKFRGYNITIEEGLENLAIPLSEKTKSKGFNILPRGSVFELGDKNVLRFFCYWKEKSQRTDYDLGCVFYDKDFNASNQVSWTNLRYDNNDISVHSGDITNSTNGASEFIDINLNKLSNTVKYIVPTINNFSGETFEEVKESIFGWMMRDKVEKGAPFEASTVKFKFDLRGPNKIAQPVAFFKENDVWKGKWMDLYHKGMGWGNRVEQNKYSTGLLMKSIIERQYLTLQNFVDISNTKLASASPKVKKSIYIGLSKPENLDKNTLFFNVNNLKDFVY